MNHRIKVVQIVSGLVVGDIGGGSELYGIRLAQALDHNQFDVHVASLWRYNRPIEQYWEDVLRQCGVTVHYGASYVPPLRYALIAAYRGLRKSLAYLRPDIVNGHAEFASIVGTALAISGIGRYFIRTSHSTLEFPHRRYLRPLIQSMYAMVAAAQVGVSPVIVQQLQQNPVQRWRNTPVHYISNAIDAKQIALLQDKCTIRDELHIGSEIPLFGIVARLTTQKGIPYALQAFAQVLERLPEARLVIVGAGPDEEELCSLAVQLGVADHVHWLGGRSDALQIIASLDVLVLSSLWEGLPTVILEAMLVGTPVVATAIPGVTELVIHQQTGLLASPADPNALAAMMILMIERPDLARQFATAAKEHVKQFTIERAVQQYTQLYLDVMKR